MRLNVRYADAHTPWLPKPSLVKRVPSTTKRWRYRKPRHTIEVGKRHFTQAQPPKAKGNTHDWRKRKPAVMQQFKSTVLRMAEPKGSTKPWRATDEYKDELAWLIDTQFMELPAEADMLRANGIKVTGLQVKSGEFSIHPSLMTGTGEYADAFAAIEGLSRVESFLRQTDEQFWFNGPVIKTRLITDGVQVGVQPAYGHVTDAHLKAAYERCRAADAHPDAVAKQMRAYKATRDLSIKWDRSDPVVQDLYKRLDALEQERVDDILTEDHEEVRVEYAPNSPCLYNACTASGEECPACYGATVVPHVLGVSGDLDFPPPGWGVRTP